MQAFFQHCLAGVLGCHSSILAEQAHSGCLTSHHNAHLAAQVWRRTAEKRLQSDKGVRRMA